MIPQAQEARKRYLIAQLRRYWPRADDAVMRLAIPAVVPSAPERLPPRMIVVPLPGWATELGVDGGLMAPQQFVTMGAPEPWRQADWWNTIFWYLNGVAERAYESAHGPIHSYSFRLRGWDPRIWQRAWVNRIALFMRRWAAREMHQDETAMFGPLPAAEILLTHDVDAIRKTMAIRFKQSAFHGYNALRLTGRGEVAQALDKLGAAVRFLLTSPDYWRFDEIEAAEARAQVKSCFFVYGGDPRRRSLKQSLFDPGYDACEQRLAGKLRALSSGGWQIGLHQSFDAWRDSRPMAAEKARLEAATSSRVTMCRQHWLRFSWRDTWRAQQAAGFETDATLGFNDRIGFRNGAALRFHPWDDSSAANLTISSLPMMLMDSHLYDYAPLVPETRAREIELWLNEVWATRGMVTVLWHGHVLSDDYGWKPGFEKLLSSMSARQPT